MKKTALPLLAARALLVLSLSVTAYALVQIVKSPYQAEQAVRKWERSRPPSTSAPVSREVPLTEAMARSASPAQRPNTVHTAYKEDDIVGILHISRLNRKIPVLEGTKEKQLSTGAGHSPGTPLPGQPGNSILAGHRDTVFRGLGEIKPGDTIEVETDAGRAVYRVTGSRIVDAEDRGAIEPSESPILTLVTCYPFGYVGPAPDRYLLTAELEQRQEQKQTQKQETEQEAPRPASRPLLTRPL